MVEVDGDTNIPTVINYSGEGVKVGRQAITVSSRPGGLLNEDFKIDLGSYDPKTLIRKRFRIQSGSEKSAAEITSDFLNELLNRTRRWLSLNGLDIAPSILLAEPLKDPDQPNWIPNYRANLTRIFVGKGFDKSKIDFLPEPFAVFQFYRYGYRHPALADKRTHRALILDFGGGTFDTFVIETKKDGDIRYNGRNSDPLGASSVPIGGFEINRQIAEHLVISFHKGNESKIKKGLEIYKKWRRTPEDLSSYSAEYFTFVQNFDRFVHDVENVKIALSRNISSWNLDNAPRISVPVRVLQDFFSVSSSSQTQQLHASELLNIFSKKIWPRLKEKIASTLNSARSQMNGASINVVLLSGGASGFGWLKMLLLRDFESEIREANVLTLPEYHAIVAKGLAIECARRFHVDKGDFGSVTYNRLCLTLDSDDKGELLPKYAAKFGTEKTVLPDGVLLPSATALGH
ncbi:hypothetical protein RBB77_13200 [Tunturibacter psychrotolerans]|uniref:Hsp70 family protein n=1 Tax=Tunturiibacter psychrotolerans TaxID=3069686 RepID=A0AAU7ZK91_9BACT